MTGDLGWHRCPAIASSLHVRIQTWVFRTNRGSLATIFNHEDVSEPIGGTVTMASRAGSPNFAGTQSTRRVRRGNTRLKSRVVQRVGKLLTTTTICLQARGLRGFRTLSFPGTRSGTCQAVRDSRRARALARPGCTTIDGGLRTSCRTTAAPDHIERHQLAPARAAGKGVTLYGIVPPSPLTTGCTPWCGRRSNRRTYHSSGRARPG